VAANVEEARVSGVTSFIQRLFKTDVDVRNGEVLKTVAAIVLLPVSGIRSATGEFEHERVRESRVVIDRNSAIVFHGVQRSIHGKCR